MSVSVTLYCRNTGAVAGDGYTNATGSKGGAYSYKYAGGSDGNGNVTVHKGTPTVISVALETTGYSVAGASVSNDPHGDVTVSTTDTTATFDDNANDVEAGIEYQVTLENGSNEETFVADPKIDNIN